MFPVGQQQPACLPSQRPGLFPVRQLGHEEHVGGTLHDSEDSVAVAVYYQIHLEVPKPFSICFFGSLVYTGPAGNGRSLAFGSAPVFELMAYGLPIPQSHQYVWYCKCFDATRWHPPFSKPLIFAVETIAPRWWFVLSSIPVVQEWKLLQSLFFKVSSSIFYWAKSELTEKRRGYFMRVVCSFLL